MKIFRLQHYYWWLIFFLALVFIASSPLYASISVTTLAIRVTLAPGESYSGSLQVTNRDKEPTGVKVYLGDWYEKPNGGNVFLKPGSLAESLAKWIDFSPSTFDLPADQSQKVNFTITVPESENGPHWAIFFVESGERTSVKRKIKKVGTTFKIGLRYGIKIYQTDPRMAEKSGEITNMDINLPNPNQQNPIELMIEFKNKGSTFLHPKGWLEFRGERGETLTKVDIPHFRILPGATRRLKLTYKDELPPGEYLALAVIDYGAENLVGGQLFFEIRKG